MLKKRYCHMHSNGVGGRQASINASTRGGGYLQTYRFSEFRKSDLPSKKDPRLLSLREIGLNATLQKIAATIGVDNFLKMWAILDNDESTHSDSGALNLHIRSFSAWTRYERNRLIKFLAGQGLSNREIAKVVADQFNERLDLSYISRLSRK
ncbi:hypothetical protein [Snodgrassella sp. B3088]|uniref:hypothetical protein n=1 Tax=Snodgrassella sp. B3088 TaxID=2818038 RepID=UPI00226A2205|nr:hypothetical protein [Snodgrassella sp. B3088]